MCSKGVIKNVFPGSNSAYGFYSLYNHIYGPQAARVYVIKGGPGVGKSSFMRAIGDEMLRHGLDVEYHHCASDNDSLDGVVIPGAGVALVDGTAPHVVDPVYPGAVEEIINLGAFWDGAALSGKKGPIIRLTGEIGRHFSQAYRLLAASRLYLQGIEECFRQAGEEDAAGSGGEAALDRIFLQLAREILGGKKGDYGPRRPRRLFATAITPRGTVSYLHDLAGGLPYVYVLRGEPGTGKEKIIGRLLDAASAKGLFVEAYHCALDPCRVDHLVIPQLKVALINSVEPHIYDVPGVYREASTGVEVEKMPPGLRAESEDFRRHYREALQGAVSFLQKAKLLHDELESYYTAQVDFAAVDRLRKEVLERIWKYTG